jgi:hypothetical protein
LWERIRPGGKRPAALFSNLAQDKKGRSISYGIDNKDVRHDRYHTSYTALLIPYKGRMILNSVHKVETFATMKYNWKNKPFGLREFLFELESGVPGQKKNGAELNLSPGACRRAGADKRARTKVRAFSFITPHH